MPSTSVALIPVTYVCMYAGYAAMLAACTFVYLSVSLSLCLSVSLCLSLSVCTPACFRSSACLAVCVKSMQTGLQLAAGSAAGLRGQAKISVFVCIICTVRCALGERVFIARPPRRGESTSVATACFICCTYHVCCMLAACTSVSRSCCLSVLLSVGPCLLSVSLSLWLSLSICTDLVCLFAYCMSVCMSA